VKCLQEKKSLKSSGTANGQIVGVRPKLFSDFCSTKVLKEHLEASREADEPEPSGAK